MRSFIIICSCIYSVHVIFILYYTFVRNFEELGPSKFLRPAFYNTFIDSAILFALTTKVII